MAERERRIPVTKNKRARWNLRFEASTVLASSLCLPRLRFFFHRLRPEMREVKLSVSRRFVSCHAFFSQEICGDMGGGSIGGLMFGSVPLRGAEAD